MDSNCLCLLCPSGPNFVRSRAILPTKPKPGTGRAQDVREQSQLGAGPEGALAGLQVQGTLCSGLLASLNLLLPATQAGGVQGQLTNPTGSTKFTLGGDTW